jgi:two-component system response regulator HydG
VFEVMSAYAWPGNVRELENSIMHALALHHGGDTIVPESLPAAISRGSATPAPVASSNGTIELVNGELPPLTDAKRKASSDFEKRYLILAMEKAKGSVSEAARLAGLDRTNFRRLLQRHGIDAAEYK